jgi:hypothetical protein
VTLNLTAELERLIADLAATLPVYHHIDPARLLVCISSARSGGISGTYAKIHPLRFPGGARTDDIRRGRRRLTVEIPAVTHRGNDILYLIYFLVPRFLDLPLREKLVTVCHELYHISTAFDGDLRRFPGRNFAHGSSRKKYNELVAGIVDEYLGLKGEGGLPRFCSATMAELRRDCRAIVARRMPAPRLKVIS